MTLVKIGIRYLNLDQVWTIRDNPSEKRVNELGNAYTIPARLRVEFADKTEVFEGEEAAALRSWLDRRSSIAA